MPSSLVAKDERLLDHHLVNVAPTPRFTGLKGLDYRMMSRMEMLGGMLILRGVAAANMSTDEAEA
jgi:hypothetical protein